VLSAFGLVASSFGCALISGIADYEIAPPPPAVDAADVSTPSATPDAGCQLDDGREGTRCGEACVDTTVDSHHCGSCEEACPPTSICEGRCNDVASAINGLRVELPCTSGLLGDGRSCSSTSTVRASASVNGSSGKAYYVRVRVRGVVEQREYPDASSAGATGAEPDGGSHPEFFVSDGDTSAADTYNVFTLDVESTDADGGVLRTFRLNAGASDQAQCFPVDYFATLRLEKGTKLALTADAIDAQVMSNMDADGNPIVVPGVPPAPEPFNGQFVQIDVDSVTPAP
jgi:hypothetical protein